VEFVKVDHNMDDVVWGLRYLNIWEKRSDEIPFYTVGKSAYLDGDTPEYHKGLLELNPVMFLNFYKLYGNVLSALSEFLGERVSLDEELAFPGFHIFHNDPVLLTVAGNWHVDLPHETLGLGDINPRAFTLAVEMPEGGGGIDLYREDYIEHKVGYMMVHDGKTTHRIASLKKAQGGRNRITLQGHIIRKEGKLVSFW
jgi:hypothetical protein